MLPGLRLCASWPGLLWTLLLLTPGHSPRQLQQRQPHCLQLHQLKKPSSSSEKKSAFLDSWYPQIRVIFSRFNAFMYYFHVLYRLHSLMLKAPKKKSSAPQHVMNTDVSSISSIFFFSAQVTGLEIDSFMVCNVINKGSHSKGLYQTLPRLQVSLLLYP